ncbi:MAG: ATP-binding cassette domain-containing protein [Planctomycetes bacterium]|jgi:ABC-2 type transport system ATP-binding protein|nr:ATP-binding cassette domain-containing protein [Planctomycetota bacterium]
MVETTQQSVIRTVGLTKVFRDFWLREKVAAVTDLNLEIRPREVFGMLGPNGSGKSTTIKMLLGLLFPTRGRIHIFDHDPTNVRVKSRIGFLPEESDLYPFLDARETLNFYGQLFHVPRRQRRQRIETLLEMVGLSAVAHRRVGEYSKGMQRRIGLAQALINDPDLLILDEPTSGLDPLGTKQFKDVIRTLATRGKTVLLSSHLLADVEDVCDRVTILYGGRERATGTLDELLARREQTQLVTDELDEATLEEVRRVLTARGRGVRDVSYPRDRLENLFLNIVEEARQQRVSHGGAIAGGQVAEFLTGAGEEGRDIIESLVGGENETPEPIEAEQAEAPVEETRDVDESILTGLQQARDVEPQTSAEAAAPADERAQPKKPDQTQADRGIIDDLLGDEP